MPANIRKINLLPPSEFELSFWGRFLRWAVTAGRYIIIVTELIVILAFLSRFKLDNDIANLSSAIEGKKNVLQANMASENAFRLVQMRATAIGKVITQRPAHVKHLDELINNLPVDIKFYSVDSLANGMVLSAYTIDEDALGVFLARLNQSGAWKGISLTQLTADKTKGINFTIELVNK